MPDRIVTCRYTKAFGQMCTAEAVDPQAEVLLCTAHLAAAQRLVFDGLRKARAREGK
jgi:hypothetical protein